MGSSWQIIGILDVDKRIPIVERKERIGGLEINLVIGKNHKEVFLTINDRATGILKMTKVKSKEAKMVERKTIELLQDLRPFINTITLDNGKEFVHHKMWQKLSIVISIFRNLSIAGKEEPTKI